MKRLAMLAVFLALPLTAFAQAQAPVIPCEQVLGGYATALENLTRRAMQAEQRATEAEKKLADSSKKPDDKK